MCHWIICGVDVRQKTALQTRGKLKHAGHSLPKCSTVNGSRSESPLNLGRLHIVTSDLCGRRPTSGVHHCAATRRCGHGAV